MMRIGRSDGLHTSVASKLNKGVRLGAARTHHATREQTSGDMQYAVGLTSFAIAAVTKSMAVAE